MKVGIDGRYRRKLNFSEEISFFCTASKSRRGNFFCTQDFLPIAKAPCGSRNGTIVGIISMVFWDLSGCGIQFGSGVKVTGETFKYYLLYI